MKPVDSATRGQTASRDGLLLTRRSEMLRSAAGLAGKSFLLAVTSLSTVAVFFIFFYITRDSLPFFLERGIVEFFSSVKWYPSSAQPQFGALTIFVGSAVVTIGAIAVAVPLGISAAVCLSDVLPFAARQLVKPVVEILAAIPSVAYGFFALVVFAPALQNNGNTLLAAASWLIFTPLLFMATVVLGDILTSPFPQRMQAIAKTAVLALLGALSLALLFRIHTFAMGLVIPSGTNALNVSVILGIMALPTIISVAEDALQASGRELREGSYALGATRAETIIKTIIPASISGILAAIILGIMRALGETMVVWMASGNAAQIPSPIYNYLMPVRTLTATIAGDMGEADHVTGSARYHVLFAMALCLLVVSFIANSVSEWIVRIQHKKLGTS